jgi:hypothetical protein
VATYGFLHTASVHVDVFTGLLAEISPDDIAVHVTDESLLADACRRHGVDDDLRHRIGVRLDELATVGAVAVVCTCSTIAGAAEEIGRDGGAEVLRVDRPMAEMAVAAGDRIAIVAALESTIGPTRALLLESAAHLGRPVTLTDSPCPAAWTHFEAGDHARYFATLASHLEALDDTADVIVLAQASMAPVEKLVQLTALVLSSPRSAVTALVQRSHHGD